MFLKKQYPYVYLFLVFLLLMTSAITYGATAMKLSLTSPQFTDGGNIPSRYTCDAQNYSIPLQWANVPNGTKSLVLIMDDPDAPMGTWDHWLLFNIPPTLHSLEENIQNLPAGVKGGHTSFGNNVYGGPCPPDREHRYFFKLYALDSLLDLPEGATKAQLEQAMQGHTLEKTELIGKYKRVSR